MCNRDAALCFALNLNQDPPCPKARVRVITIHFNGAHWFTFIISNCRIDEFSGHEVCAFYDNLKLRRGFYLILVGITSVVLLLEIAIYVKSKGAKEIDLYGENDRKIKEDQETEEN